MKTVLSAAPLLILVAMASVSCFILPYGDLGDYFDSDNYYPGFYGGYSPMYGGYPGFHGGYYGGYSRPYYPMHGHRYQRSYFHGGMPQYFGMY